VKGKGIRLSNEMTSTKKSLFNYAIKEKSMYNQPPF
jgi:hypothetical protein